jgi:Calcineurin-like phosphoesterase
MTMTTTRRALVLVLALAGTATTATGCVGSANGVAPAPDLGIGVVDPNAAKLSFGVFGDVRPGSPGDTANYPTAVIANIFTIMQARGLQFAVGTGDYMFANTQTDVDAQLALLASARANFAGPVYHAMGNHECDGATGSNCPNGDETPNVRAFVAQLTPAGTAKAYYRVDVATRHGKAKFLFIAPNAWTTEQSSWLAAQLADPTTYTFAIRHEPSGTAAPGVDGSDHQLVMAPFSMLLLGHFHEYRRYDVQHVISGNGGAPVRAGETAGFGFLWIQELDDGNLSATEIDQTTGNAVDTFQLTPNGSPVPG